MPECAERWRMISILSYFIVLIGFGLPIWWHTTRVYRATLPLDEMLELHPTPPSPLHIRLHASTDSRSQLLSNEIQSVLGTTIICSPHIGKVTLPVTDSEADIELAAQAIAVPPGGLVFVEWPKASKDLVLTGRRVVYFASGVSGYRLAMLVQQWPGVDLNTALADPKLGAGDKSELRAFPAAPKYDVLVTVVVPDPLGVKLEWNLQEALQNYLQPYLNTYSKVANFTVKSQWLYFVELGVNPRHVGDHWALAEQLLPHIITPLEKKLSSHVSKHPCVNFVIYVPPCSMAPIHIYTKAGVKSAGPVDAFVSPRWGGVMITNPDCNSTTYTPNSQLMMSTVISQLNQLFGVPNLMADAPTEILQTGRQPAEWQQDFLLRARTLEYLEASRLTLRSLAQLLSEISNIVINDDVADSVRLAVSNTARAEHLLRHGDVFEAFQRAQTAALAAESAFTDPSLLALLYFPDDQKYAVYIPLFLPIMIPVIMSMKQVIYYLRKTK